MGAYLQRSQHGTIFYFRRRLPNDLRPRLGVPQLFVLLGTADRSVVLILARRAATRCDELFHVLRTTAKNKPNDELMRVIRDWQRTFALREEIWRLRDEALEAHFQRNATACGHNEALERNRSVLEPERREAALSQTVQFGPSALREVHGQGHLASRCNPS